MVCKARESHDTVRSIKRQSAKNPSSYHNDSCQNPSLSLPLGPPRMFPALRLMSWLENSDSPWWKHCLKVVPSSTRPRIDWNSVSWEILIFPGGLWVDFDSTDARRRSHHTGSELLVQAAKIRRIPHPLLIDTTAGLGRDAFLLATHGFRVEMVERNPVVAALLEDGLTRARCVPRLQAATERIRLCRGNSLDVLAQLREKPAVIYLDPMFPQRSKTAKVKQNLRLLQYLDDHAIAPESLLEAALLVGANKVVVKRPLKGAPLAERLPSYSLKGKAIRFDIYLGPGKKEPPEQPGQGPG